MDHHIGYIMTVSNSIIGVSILAMPYCFKQCGIILAIVMLLASGIISRLTCHYLLKSATMARRRTFELLSFHIFGKMGKLMVELGIIGFLMGTCVAFFVIIGDLGPAIIAKLLNIENNDSLRTTLLICLAIFCVVPLGLLKNVESLSSVSTATIGFYFCLVLKTIAESATHFAQDNWLSKVELWRPQGMLQCLPIFAMALSCQTQLFEIYETLPNASLEKMNYVVRSAVNICVAVYICVGFFGYVAFANYQFTGNILMSFSPSVMTDAMKIGFVLSVACSFPLVIFPCRASLYSLLFKKGYTPYEGTSNFIPENRFKLLTLFIVSVSLTIGILIPNIEVVLGLLGSTIGTMICVIFPVTCFICISTKNTTERIFAQIMLFIGVIMMVMGTYANLYAMEEINAAPAHIERIQLPNINPVIESVNIVSNAKEKYVIDIKKGKIVKDLIINKPSETVSIVPLDNKIQEILQEIRREPPQPVEPIEELQEDLNKKKNLDEKINQIEPNKEAPPLEIKIPEKLLEIKSTKMLEVDKAAIEKEDNELKEEMKENKNVQPEEKNADDLIATLEKHKEEQKSLIKQQKELLEEIKKETKELKDKHLEDIQKDNDFRVKAANQIVEIAKKAIESLGPKNENMKNAEKLIDNLNPKLNNTEQKSSIQNVPEKNMNLQMIKNDNSPNIISEQKVLVKNTENVIHSNNMSKNKPENKMVPLPILMNKYDNSPKKDINKPFDAPLSDPNLVSNKISENEVQEKIKNKQKPLETVVKEISLVDGQKENKLITEKADLKMGTDRAVQSIEVNNLNKNVLPAKNEEVKVGRDILEHQTVSSKPFGEIIAKNEQDFQYHSSNISKTGREILENVNPETIDHYERKKREAENKIKKELTLSNQNEKIVSQMSTKGVLKENENCNVNKNLESKTILPHILSTLSQNKDILKDSKDLLNNFRLTQDLLTNHENFRRRK